MGSAITSDLYGKFECGNENTMLREMLGYFQISVFSKVIIGKTSWRNRLF